MATKFSPCKGSYVLNQFPSNVMFGMNGFHLSASGAIQGHHGPLVYFDRHENTDGKEKMLVPLSSLPSVNSMFRHVVLSNRNNLLQQNCRSLPSPYTSAMG